MRNSRICNAGSLSDHGLPARIAVDAGRTRLRRRASTGRAATTRNFTVRSGDPAACAARCERERRCRAWSFSYPLTAGHARSAG